MPQKCLCFFPCKDKKAFPPFKQRRTFICDATGNRVLCWAAIRILQIIQDDENSKKDPVPDQMKLSAIQANMDMDIGRNLDDDDDDDDDENNFIREIRSMTLMIILI